jgi:uncharacterized damage-inducible protein DinB
MPEPEPWLRGPVPGVDALLQPAAHALLQTLEDVEPACAGLTPAQLAARPGGVASVAFHLRHLVGSTDRLLTYARGETLSDAQKAWARAEGQETGADAATLLAGVRSALEQALAQLRATPPADVRLSRRVGRAGLPSTVLGLLFHAGEHSQRHAGQVVTTARLVRALGPSAEAAR